MLKTAAIPGAKPVWVSVPGAFKKWCETCLGNCPPSPEMLLPRLRKVVRNLFGKLPKSGAKAVWESVQS